MLSKLMRQSRMLGVVPLLALPLFAGCGGAASALPEGEGEAGEPSAGTAEEHLSAVDLWVANYGHNAGGWRVGQHPRMMADVNADGRADIVGFGNAGAYISLSTGSGFTAPVLAVANYGYDAGGWRVEQHPRMMSDVNGDGKADIVGFGNAGVYVSLD